VIGESKRGSKKGKFEVGGSARKVIRLL